MTQFPPSSFDPNQFEFADKPPAWPLVIGWLSIAWAALGTVCGVCAVGFFAVLPAIMPMPQGPLPPAMQMSVGMLAQLVVGTLMGIFLLTSGILCLRRNPTSRILFFVYAVASLLFVCYSVYFQFQQGAAMAKWAAENPDSPFAAGYKNPTQIKAQEIGGMIFGIVLGAAFPVFLLVWFGFIKTRPEQFGHRGVVVA